MLDFGCGTGYGAALLAERSRSVVGVDIDMSALDWAKRHHRAANLVFEQRSDLGASLPAASFDLITCFEVIEHVPEEVQVAVVRSFARLLADQGVALISTPNPEITKLYGSNPYHIREMTRSEFTSLLGAHFPFVTMLQQWVQPSVLIEGGEPGTHTIRLRHLSWSADSSIEHEPPVFIAVCSRHPLPEVPGACFLDFNTDYIPEQLSLGEQLNHARMRITNRPKRLCPSRIRFESATKSSKVARPPRTSRARLLRACGAILINRHATSRNCALPCLQRTALLPNKTRWLPACVAITIYRRATSRNCALPCLQRTALLPNKTR